MTIYQQIVASIDLPGAQIHPAGFAPVSIEMLQDIVTRIIQGVQPEKVILFGSYACGHPTPDSDLDLLVIMETSAQPAERVLEVSRLLRPRPFPMDILVRTPSEIEDSLQAGDSFIQDVFSHGKVLYDRSA